MKDKRYQNFLQNKGQGGHHYFDMLIRRIMSGHICILLCQNCNYMLINMVTRAYKKFCILGCCYNISKYLLYKF